jgi:hypothetical protein
VLASQPGLERHGAFQFAVLQLLEAGTYHLAQAAQLGNTWQLLRRLISTDRVSIVPVFLLLHNEC